MHFGCRRKSPPVGGDFRRQPKCNTCILIFDAPFAEVTLYDAVVSSPATSELNPALEQSCALAYCARQQMNTIDFSIFMLALIFGLRSSKALMVAPEFFFYVPWHCPTFHSSPISGISRHTHSHKGDERAWPSFSDLLED